MALLQSRRLEAFRGWNKTLVLPEALPLSCISQSLFLCAVCRLPETFCEWVRVAHIELAPGKELEQEKSLSDTKVRGVLKDGYMM